MSRPGRRALGADLRRVAPASDVLVEPEDLVAYLGDSTPYRGVPDAVAVVRREADVAALVKFAYAHDLPIIPRGAGSGIAGGVVPVQGGLVLDLCPLDEILELDVRNLTATVQCGIPNARLGRAVAAHGLYYPPDPASLEVSTIGGNVATRAGGPKGVKYGTTEDYLLGLRAVLWDGEIVQAGGKTTKNSTGYSLTQLFAGSEGTLGVILTVTVRLIPAPAARSTFLAVFETLDQAAEAVSEIIGQGIIPATLELLDQVALEAIELYASCGLPTDVDGVLLIEVDGHPAEVQDAARRATGVCESMGAREVRVARSEQEVAALWAGRRAMFPALARLRPTALVEDATVPRTRVPDAVRGIRKIAKEYGLHVSVPGHAGDGNMHPIILTDKRDREEMERVEAALAAIARLGLELGGTLSGEHGIGMAKSRYLELELGARGVRAMADLKKAFDPKGLFNPGKVFTPAPAESYQVRTIGELLRGRV